VAWLVEQQKTVVNTAKSIPRIFIQVSHFPYPTRGVYEQRGARNFVKIITTIVRLSSKMIYPDGK
jgi:hypothetical protein